MRRAGLFAAISAAALCISMVGNVPMASMAQEEARAGTEAFASGEAEAETEAASGAEVETGTNAATGTDAGIADEEEAAAQEAVCEEIFGEESSELTASITDFEYSDNEDGTVTITKYKGSDTEVVIPAKISGKQVTAIGNGAFDGCRSLTSVEIPKSVTSIGNGAFFCCSSLTSVEIPKSVTAIGDYAFCDCKSLEKIELLSGVTTIGDAAFAGCRALTSVEIPESVTSIGSSAFSGCVSLKKIGLSSGVTTIGNAAFNNCSALTGIEIPSTVTNIGTNVFYCCFNLASVKVAAGNANYATSNGILYTKNMTDLIYCPVQKKGTMRIPSGVIRIWDGAFAGCTGLTSIEFPSSLTSIGYQAFAGCTGLTSIKIPEGVTSVGSAAFMSCTGVTKIELPSSLTSLDDTVFGYCTKVSSVKVAAGNANYTVRDGILYTKDMTYLKYCPATREGTVGIPSGVTKIGTYAFQYCKLTSIEIPSSVTSIGDESFYGCDNLTIYGVAGSEAEAYAKRRKIPFVALPEDSDLSKFTVYADDTVYNGYYQTPQLYIEYDGKRIPLIEGSSYTGTVSRKAAGTTTVTITGTGYYTGEATVSFTVIPLNLKNALEAGDVVLTATDLEYTGRLQQSTVKVTYKGRILTEGTDYTLKGNGRKAVGTSWAVVTGTGNYKGTIKIKYAMKKASQSNMMVYTKDKRAVDVRTQGATIQLMTSRVRDGAKIVYSVEQPGQGITVSSGGKVTVKKGTKPGKYRIKVLAESTPYYKATSKYFTIVVK